MWEVLVRTPRGTFSPRKFSLLLATILMASFGYILAGSSIASAATDVTWDGNTVLYESNTYEPISDTSDLPSDVASSPAVYQRTQTGDLSQTVHFIYFSTDDPQSEKEATYVRYTLNPPNNYTNKSGEKTLSSTPVPADERLDTEDGIVRDSCTIDGIGWMVCPVMNSISEGIDFIFERIRGFLVVQPISSDTNNPVYRIWQVSRDFANIIFIIGFLIIIYNYIVGGGMKGYEIRKIIPRLVIAAVLINISYVISAVAVDISNIAGYGVNQLFEQVRDGALAGASASDDVPVSWTSVTTWVLAGGVGTGVAIAALPGTIGGAAGLWYLLAPFLVGAALLVIVTFLILAARQAIIIIAIAIAPLAFAALILPNTEKWFERWRGIFFTMLIMFPAFAAVFGGAQLAGEIIIRSANSIELIILGLGVMVAPLAITPLLLKLGGGVLGRIGGMINSKEKGMVDRFRNYSGERRKDAVAQRQAANAAARRSGDYSGFRRGTQTWRRRAGANYAKAAYRKDLRERNEESANNDWHSQTGRWGYDSHDEDVRSRYTGRPASGYRNLNLYKRDNQLQHDLDHAHHEEHWQQTVNADAARRQMLTDTRLSDGRAKVIQGALEAQDDRAFQVALDTDATYANLRAMKVKTSVDKGVADIASKAIDADGAAELAETILSTNSLKQRVIRTHEQQSRASQANELIEDAAKASWQETSLTDQVIYSRQLERQSNAKQIKALEAQWDTILTEAAAGNTDDYVGKFGPTTVEVDDSITRLGTANRDIAVEEMRKAGAEYVGKVQLNKALKSDDTLLARAAGIDPEGKIKVVSELSKKGSALHMQNVEAVESFMSNEGYTMEEEKLILQGHAVRGRSAPTDTERHAAMRRILLTNGNNWAAQEVYDYVVSQGLRYDPNAVDADGKQGAYFDENGAMLTSDEASTRRDLQQIWIDAVNKSPLKVDYISGTQKGLAENGLLQRTDTSRTASEQSVIDDINKAKIKGERIAGADIDIITRQLQIFSSQDAIDKLDETKRQQYVETIYRTLDDPMLGGRMSEREWAHTKVLANMLNSEDNRPMDVKRSEYVNRNGEPAKITPVEDRYNYTQTP